MCFLQQPKMNATLAKIRAKMPSAPQKQKGINPHTTISQLLEVSVFAAGAGFAAESVLQKPDPLKTIPTVEQTLRTSPLHSGHSVRGASEKD
ncbi:hypothetical protein FGO68_gene17581 [Halteria grandinella]|uniref:Uncharacterized protein n=1 Tax=Halteria grandinella TaxID=5974 RepID=A0A8J8N8R3_HALGN|nr:hypothetical protein FGO68_gene17581 [Halteria grandinella]